MRDAICKLLQTGKTARVLQDQACLEARLEKIEEDGVEALPAPSAPAPKWPDALPSPRPTPLDENSEGRNRM